MPEQQLYPIDPVSTPDPISYSTKRQSPLKKLMPIFIVIGALIVIGILASIVFGGGDSPGATSLTRITDRQDKIIEIIDSNSSKIRSGELANEASILKSTLTTDTAELKKVAPSTASSFQSTINLTTIQSALDGAVQSGQFDTEFKQLIDQLVEDNLNDIEAVNPSISNAEVKEILSNTYDNLR